MSFGLTQSGGDGNYTATTGSNGSGTIAGEGNADGAETFGGGKSIVEDSSDDIDPSTPWTAIAEGNLALLQRSLQRLQYPIYVADDIQGYTLLQAAASYSHTHILQYIWSELERCNNHSYYENDTTTVTTRRPEGGYQNATDHDGDTALHYAGSVDAMKFLVDICNVDINIVNKTNLTALNSKRTEMNEMEQDLDDFDEDDMEYIQIKRMVEYLDSISMNPQQC